MEEIMWVCMWLLWPNPKYDDDNDEVQEEDVVSVCERNVT